MLGLAYIERAKVELRKYLTKGVLSFILFDQRGLPTLPLAEWGSPISRVALVSC